MEGLMIWKKRLLPAFASVGLLLLTAAEGRAELLHSAVAPEDKMAGVETEKVEFMAQGSRQAAKVSHAREDWQAVCNGVRGDWDALRQAVACDLLEMTTTGFFIRGGTPPPKAPPPPGGNGSPPGQQGNPPGGGGNPPGPQGNGEGPPPGDPGGPPAVGTPEPSSFVIAIVGVGLGAGFGWRKRRQAQ